MKSITNYLSSFVLVTIAAIIFLLLVVSIPLAFMLTYHKSGGNISQNERVPESVHRYHNAWPSISTIRGKLSVQMYSLIPPDVNTCRAYGFFCTSDPVFTRHFIFFYPHFDTYRDIKLGQTNVAMVFKIAKMEVMNTVA